MFNNVQGKSSRNDLGFLMSLGILWYVSENARCTHGVRKRDNCQECASAYRAKQNMIYTTGLLYSLVTNFFQVVGDLILFTIRIIVIAFTIFFLTEVLFFFFTSSWTMSFNLPQLLINLSYIAVLLLAALRIDSAIKCVRNRNKIFYKTSEGKTERLPQATHSGFWSGKNYVGSFPNVFIGDK